MSNMQYNFEDIRNIYSKLEDEISRQIFLVRLNYSATGDVNFVYSISPQYRNLASDTESFAKKIKSNKKIALFGAGGRKGSCSAFCKFFKDGSLY